MTADPIEEAIRQAKAEGKLWPVVHLWRQDILSEEVWVRLVDSLPINGGRSPGEFTEADHAHRQRFLEEVRAIMRQRGLTGNAARVRIAEEIHPRYSALPSGKIFTETRAIGIAEKNDVSSVRKGTKS